MYAITVALITTAAIGLHFSSTRSFGMAAIAVLAFIYPVFVSAALISAVVAFYLPKLLTTERKSS
jgi:hypothetical protein